MDVSIPKDVCFVVAIKRNIIFIHLSLFLFSSVPDLPHCRKDGYYSPVNFFADAHCYDFWPTVLSVVPLVHCVVCLSSVCDILYCGETVRPSLLKTV